MSDEELDKLAAAMKNMKPSDAARKSGMDAAMSAFDAEFASETVADGQKTSATSQGLEAGARPTGQTTRNERAGTQRSGIMQKFNNMFSYNPKVAMMLGSCAAAMMFAIVIVPSAIDSPMEGKSSPQFDSIAAEVGADEIVVTGSRKADADSASAAPQAEAEAGVTSVADIVAKVRSDSASKKTENAAREQKFRQNREAEISLGSNRQANDLGYMAQGSAPSQSASEAAPVETLTIERRVVKPPASTVERIVPSVTKQITRRVQRDDGTFETVTETVVVQEASTELVTVPPTYETVSETVVVQAGSRDKFETFDTNPVISSKETPVSTFSIDVDTASYSFLRSSINRGQLPPPSAIRLEEMINYFPYDYEPPRSANEPFKANVTVTQTPWNAETKLMHIGIKGYVPQQDEKPRSNIVLLIDTSGSMGQPNKLPLLINSFKLLLGTLDADDTVSIVTYAGNAGTVLEPTSASDKTKIYAALNRLSAGGSTAGAAGLELAYMKAQENFDDEGVNRVILATDGDFNVGFSSHEDMKQYITKKRKTGIFLSVLGFGNGNYNDQLMQSLAQNGNGMAAYIDSLAEANKVLADEAGSALFTIAKDVKIQVEFNPATISEYRLIGYETRALKREDFNNDAVDAGEIGAGHSVTAIYELTPAGSSARVVDDLRYASDEAQETLANDSDEYAFIKIRHKLPNADKSTLQTFPIGPDQERKTRRASDDTRFAAAVAAVGQKLRGDTQLADFSYQDAIKLASGAKGKDEHGYRSEFIQLVRLIDSMEK